MLNIIESVSGQPVSACFGNAISPSRSWLLLRSFFALFIPWFDASARTLFRSERHRRGGPRVSRCIDPAPSVSSLLLPHRRHRLQTRQRALLVPLP